MSALPPSFETAPDTERASFAQTANREIGMRWAAVTEAAHVVAALAGLEPEHATPEFRDFAVRVDSADAWRRGQAENGIADLAAVLEPGIAALLAINARGADPRPAAMALWLEFVAAREAVLSLVPAREVAENGAPGRSRLV